MSSTITSGRCFSIAAAAFAALEASSSSTSTASNVVRSKARRAASSSTSKMRIRISPPTHSVSRFEAAISCGFRKRSARRTYHFRARTVPRSRDALSGGLGETQLSRLAALDRPEAASSVAPVLEPVRARVGGMLFTAWFPQGTACLDAAHHTQAASGFRQTLLDVAAYEVNEAPEHALPVRAQAVVLVLARHPRMQTADRGGSLFRVLALDVEVVRVDGCRGRHVVPSQPLDVVELGPHVLREQLGCVADWAKGAVVLEHPGIDVLAGEERRVLAELSRENSLG